mmetsp:Transcript_36895/g.119074  ORF Transcript_36895/g.119074 Transcript_36895/m.119074 type:complete len:308 (-) Transcript_36895:269-1192(-)
MQQTSGLIAARPAVTSSYRSSKKRANPVKRRVVRCATERSTPTVAQKKEASAPRHPFSRRSGSGMGQAKMSGIEKPIRQPSTTERRVCCMNSSSRLPPPSAPPSPAPPSCSELTTSCVSAKSSTTTTSISTVTVRTVVVKGPLACSSSMIAMAEDGERATARHAMISAAEMRCDSGKSTRKGRKRSPRARVLSMDATHVTETRPVRTETAADKFSRTSLRWSLPPADRPMKPSATSLSQRRRRDSSEETTSQPYGPATTPKKRKVVMAGKPSPDSSEPKVCADIPTRRRRRSAGAISLEHSATHPSR